MIESAASSTGVQSSRGPLLAHHWLTGFFFVDDTDQPRKAHNCWRQSSSTCLVYQSWGYVWVSRDVDLLLSKHLPATSTFNEILLALFHNPKSFDCRKVLLSCLHKQHEAALLRFKYAVRYQHVQPDDGKPYQNVPGRKLKSVSSLQPISSSTQTKLSTSQLQTYNPSLPLS